MPGRSCRSFRHPRKFHRQYRRRETADVLALVEQIRDKARAERGIEMEMEVKVIGEDEYTF
jgi:hypothetical protein